MKPKKLLKYLILINNNASEIFRYKDIIQYFPSNQVFYTVIGYLKRHEIVTEIRKGVYALNKDLLRSLISELEQALKT